MLKEKALLVKFSSMCPTGKKKDRKATQETADNYNANSGKIEVVKKLFDTNEFKILQASIGKARQYFYENTVAWEDEGFRLLKASHYLQFQTKVLELKNDVEVYAKKFVEKLEDIKEQNKINHGSLYSEADYPSMDRLENSIGIHFSFRPLPEMLGQIEGMMQEDVEAINNQLKESLVKAQADAMKDVWERLYGVVKHLNERMESDGRVYDSAFDNVIELCNLLPKLNLLDDPNLEDMRRKIVDKIYGVIPDNVREDESERKKVASDTSAILEAMEDYMRGRE